MLGIIGLAVGVGLSVLSPSRNDFIHFYQVMDVLIIDDVQFFSSAFLMASKPCSRAQSLVGRRANKAAASNALSA